jgi:hypothetical protein
MTREEMVKSHWKPYMIIDYKDDGMKFPAECLLSAIDFDAEILTLTPINDFYNQTEFEANLKFCSIPKRLKAAAVHGQKIKEPTENFIKAKMDILEDDTETEYDDAG